MRASSALLPIDGNKLETGVAHDAAMIGSCCRNPLGFSSRVALYAGKNEAPIITATVQAKDHSVGLSLINQRISMLDHLEIALVAMSP